MIGRVAGNLSIGLALLLYAVPLPLVFWSPRGHDGGQGYGWGLILVLVPLWFLLAVALLVSAMNGGLDWTRMARGWQFALVLVTSLAMAVVTTLSGMLRYETADQIPWAVRPLTPFGWAMWVFPLVVILFSAVTINASLGGTLPPFALETMAGVVGGISLLVSFGMLAQWFAFSMQKQAARDGALVAEAAQRPLRELEELRGYDANKDFYIVLGYTNPFNDPRVRALALEKIRAVPNLDEQLAGTLRGPGYDRALMFLATPDASADRALAEAVRDAFLLQAQSTRERMQQPSDVRADDFDFDCRSILSVAEKFRSYGVDYVPAIRSFRSALDEPHHPNVRFACAAQLDDWLARETKSGK